METILINGQPGQQIPVTDRALHYGDGLFETIACINGAPRFWERHVTRLLAGCERLGIPPPDTATLRSEIARLASTEAACVVKVIISRGSGGRGYRPPLPALPTRVVIRYPFPEYPPSHSLAGVRVRLCETPLGCNPRLAGIKHLNRLEQVLARSEWDESDIAEGLMGDGDGHLVEGTMSNLFLVKDGVLLTPDLSRCGVEGVMRSVVMELAREMRIALQICPLEAAMLGEGSELFLTNSLIGIWPVTRCGEHHYPCGPITRQLQQALAPLLELPHA